MKGSVSGGGVGLARPRPATNIRGRQWQVNSDG